MNLYRYTCQDFFRIIDVDQSLLITIDEWSKALHDMKQGFTQEEIDKFFNYMDQEKIGLIDLKQFTKVMQANAHDKLEVKFDYFIVIILQSVYSDSFLWPYQVISKMRLWFKKQEITAEAAFRVMDSDFDGYIGIDDLR